MFAAQDSLAHRQTTGIIVLLDSAMIVGWAPIFGKMAYRTGVDPYTLAALRTIKFPCPVCPRLPVSRLRINQSLRECLRASPGR